jgi:Tfp pilus assembly protein PilF
VYEQAVKLAEGQVKINSKDYDATSQLAGYYADVGRKSDARAMALKALSLAPENGDVLRRIGMMHEILGAREQALAMLAQAVKKNVQMTEIDFSPEMKQLREDPKYQKLVKEAKGSR